MDSQAPAGMSAGVISKVLVIDDSNTIRRSAELFLKAAGCEVILAEDGFDALAKIADQHPQVIFVVGFVVNRFWPTPSFLSFVRTLPTTKTAVEAKEGISRGWG